MALKLKDGEFTVDVCAEIESDLQPLPTKSYIIDRELNQHGMGRYQWLIWAICGTGFFLDLMWFQAFTLAVSNIQRELGFSDKEFGNASIALTAGVAVGAFTWGVLVDVIGRRMAFYGSSLVAGIFGTCSGFVSSYNGLLVMVAFIGFGVGGNVPIDSTITVEYLPENRFYLLAALSIYQPVGLVVCSLIAYALIPKYSCSVDLVSCRLTGGVAPCCSREANMGWRYLLFAVGAITLAIFILRFFIFPFYESPKFLLAKGDDRSAVEIVRKVAAFNKRPCDLTVESLREQCQETPISEQVPISKRIINEITRLKLLFGTWRMARVALLIWITWVFDYWGYGIAGTYLPVVLQRKNIAVKVSLEQTYIDYLIVFSPGTLGVVLSVLMVRSPTVGRKWTLVFSSMLTSLSIFLFSIVNTETKRVGLEALNVFCQVLFNATLFGWTPEAFPAAVRGTASGWALFFATLLGIPASFIAEDIFSSTNGSNAVLYMAGSGVLVCSIAMLCLPAKDMVAPR